MPGASGLSGLISLRGIHPAVPLVVVSAHDDPVTIRRALDLGASGFISKSASMEEIRRAVETVLAGDIAAPAGIELGVERDPEMSDLIQPPADADAAADARARHAGRGPAQQADRL